MKKSDYEIELAIDFFLRVNHIISVKIIIILLICRLYNRSQSQASTMVRYRAYFECAKISSYRTKQKYYPRPEIQISSAKIISVENSIFLSHSLDKIIFQRNYF